MRPVPIRLAVLRSLPPRKCLVYRLQHGEVVQAEKGNKLMCVAGETQGYCMEDNEGKI